MALLDFLKKKDDQEKSKKQPVKKTDLSADKAGKVSAAKKTAKKSADKVGKKAEKKETTVVSNPVEVGNFSYEVVREPLISEKSTVLAEKNKYVFKVTKGANKHEIAKSVAGVYKVDVVSVNVLKIPKKKRRLGRTEGFKKGYAKAIVTIKEGQKIEIF